MKIISANLILFTAIGIVLAIAFNLGTIILIRNHMQLLIWVMALIYGALLFISGRKFGSKDKLSEYYAGWRYNIAAFIFHNAVTILLFLYVFSRYDRSLIGTTQLNWWLVLVFNIPLLWGVVLIIHFLVFLAKKSKRDSNR